MLSYYKDEDEYSGGRAPIQKLNLTGVCVHLHVCVCCVCVCCVCVCVCVVCVCVCVCVCYSVCGVSE